MKPSRYPKASGEMERDTVKKSIYAKTDLKQRGKRHKRVAEGGCCPPAAGQNLENDQGKGQ